MLKTWLRRLGLGKAMYTLWFAPLARWRATRRIGGIRAQRAMNDAEVQMMQAAAQLSTATGLSGPPLIVYFLTGHRFWHQSAYCAWSLARSSGRPVQPHFFDDGSLTDSERAQLSAVFPLAVHHPRAQCLQRLQERLPQQDFPNLHLLWHTYPNIRKLIDPHLLGGNWKLVLDSDMLFFAKPVELLAWLHDPQQPVHMLDVMDAYGYPVASLEALSGARLPSRVNVGVTGLNSAALDFAELEAWCAQLIGAHGRHYFLEQALIAAWVGRSGAQALPASRYRLLAGPDSRPGQACLDHYVADAKGVYFHQAWRLCQQHLGTTT